MSRLGFKSVVYHGDIYLGELDSIPVQDSNFQFPNNEIRIHHLSPISERCPPLSVLQTISSFSIRCKLESNSPVEHSNLISLHAACFYELKTAVVLLGGEELHLVAMPSKQKKFPCFWCYAVPYGLYASCLRMLNMRCLSIVFDLDETLIVANTMKSFEDRIEALRSWVGRDADPSRASGLSAQLRRYVDDRALLKQYAENDSVIDNGKTFKVQLEEVASLSDNQERILRPVIRLQERNIVLTRINPEIRDTSVLVRLRPAWEDLRSYLTAKGRKRFEVYVCTMAERDYALEMWRLLDPEAHLISPKQLLHRVVCVSSGSKKSLLNVFQNGICHPKMAMVIDDRLKVWEDMDQPRVHVVPAFTPYHAPQAETSNAVPVLCVARNVACNVRGGFFKEFDENLLRRISDIFYEDEIKNLPPAPDVSNYMMSEDAGFVPNGNNNAAIMEGMHGVEVERRLNQWDEKNSTVSVTHPTISIPELKSEIPQPPQAAVSNVIGPASFRAPMPSQKSSVLGAPGRDGMRIGLDSRNQSSGNPPILPRVPIQLPTSVIRPQGWLVEEDINRGSLNNRASGVAQANQNSFSHGTLGSTPSGLLPHPSQVKGEEGRAAHEWQKQNHRLSNQPSDLGISQNQVPSNGREPQTEAGKVNAMASAFSIGVLQEIARKCSSRVEFKSVVSTSKDLQFSVEVLFTGERIGFGMGKTRKDAQQHAAENALHSLADKYVAHQGPATGDGMDRDFTKLSLGNENGFLWDVTIPGTEKGDGLLKEGSNEVEVALGSSSNVLNQQLQKRANSPRTVQSISNKRTKDEQLRGSQSSFSSSRQHKDGHPIS